jgi:hypothetical protein
MNNSGITNFNVLNTNALYIRGIEFDGTNNDPALQAQIDAIEQQLIPIEAITTRIDFSQQPLLIGNLVITEDNKNSVLLTAIQALQQSIGNINKLDLTALPAAPPASCVITPTTTNQALKALIDTNTGDITTIEGEITTIQGDITTIQGQITSINNSITAINAKLAHFSTFQYGNDTMSGIADGTGFAAAVSGGSASGNGIFVYPNNSSVGTQIQMVTAYDKDLLIRGGNKTAIYAGNDGSMLNRNLIDIGDVTDRISIGRNQALPNPAPRYSLISIGVDTSIEGAASTTEVEGDIYFSSYAFYPAGVTPCLVAETTNPAKLGNTNNYSSDLTLTGLDVTGAGIAPITLTAVSGAIPITAALGLISLTALAGGITLATGAGVMTINCGAGGFFLNSGAGVMNFASGQGNINMTTIAGDIVLGAGKALGGTAGDTILNAFDKIVLSPDNATEIFKTAYIEMNTNATAPAITASRVYDVSGTLYYNGAPLGGGGGNQYVLKAGDTMTGTLNLPEAATSILTLTNLTTAPVPVTNRLYLLNNVLTFNGVAVGGAGSFLPLTGGTLTGPLNINYDAGQVIPQLQIVNTNNTAPVGGQGAAINLRNDSTGVGSIGERCGKIDFAAKDSAGGGGRTYAAIQGYINDPTNTAIDGRLSHFVASNNTLTEFTRLVSTSTGVRQMNINAQNTTIGTSALGSASTDTLRVQGSTSITTTLDVPLIQNAPAIYPATSTTLVDGAVKQYRPERVFRLNDYPNPLSGPSIDGEKVIVLNSGGNPANVVDSILQSSDFPAINGATFVRILQSKYVEGTNGTPPMNVITAVYNEPNQRIHIFVQPDVAGVLSLTRVATLYFSQGQALVNDFCVTTYQSKTRIYAGGQFLLVDTPAPYASTNTANYFSGQIVVSWSGGTISNIVCNPMVSNYVSGLDQGMFGGINGVNFDVNCVIDATGFSGISQPPTSGFNKYDTIVIGGEFSQIDATNVYRPLRRIAYFDWFSGTGSTISLVNQPPPITFNQIIGSADLTAQFTIPSEGTYVITAGQMSYYTTNPTGYAASFGIYLFNQNTSSSSLVSDLSPFTLDGDSTPNRGFTSNAIQLTPQTGGNYYYIRCNTGGPDIVPLDVYVGLQNNATDARAGVATAVLTGNNPIGWRAFQDSSWTTPEGPDAPIQGGALLSNGGMVFAYDATTITILQNPSSITANYAFSLQVSGGQTSWAALNGDQDSIATGQGWNFNSYNRNCVTGGNPVLAFGAGNAIAYGEVYLNTGNYNSQSANGVSYRPSTQDPYETTDCLVVNSNFSFSADQLKPQFSSQPCYAVYRDDTRYQGVFFIARGNELATATLPFQGGIPNYNVIQNGTNPIPCFSFGGYSDEIGYQGALFATNTNLYLYKLTSSGELVIDLSGCVVRTFNDVTPSNPIVATNKLTFPALTDGGSVTLCGDTSTNPVSWWAISQDGPLYYDNTLIGGSGGGGGGVNSVTGSGAGISVTPTTGAVVVSNTGVTELGAGSGIAVSSQTGQVTLSTQTGYAKWFIDSNNLVIIENAATGQGVEVAYPFPAPTSTTGIGNNFVVGSGGRIRWTGLNPIAISGQLSIQATLQHFQNGSWFNVINISQLPNQQPALVGFGARILVTDSQGNANTNSPACYNYFLNQTSSLDTATNPAPVGGLVGSMTFNTNMRTNDELYVIFITNGAFNTGNASSYRILFGSNITSSTNGGISFNISEMPFV